jgi:hypothetical protein
MNGYDDQHREAGRRDVWEPNTDRELAHDSEDGAAGGTGFALERTRNAPQIDIESRWIYQSSLQASPVLSFSFHCLS